MDGALVLDLSQFEVVESTDQTGSIKKAFQADPYEVDAMMEQQRQETYKHALGTDATFSDGDFTFGPLPPWVVLGASEPLKETPKDRSRGAVGMQHAKFSEFLVNNPEGRIYEHVVPSWIRHAIPTTGLHYAMSKSSGFPERILPFLPRNSICIICDCDSKVVVFPSSHHHSRAHLQHRQAPVRPAGRLFL